MDVCYDFVENDLIYKLGKCRNFRVKKLRYFLLNS